MDERVLETYSFFEIDTDVALESAMDTIKEKIKNFIQKIKEFIEKVKKWISEKFDQFIKKITDEEWYINKDLYTEIKALTDDLVSDAVYISTQVWMLNEEFADEHPEKYKHDIEYMANLTEKNLQKAQSIKNKNFIRNENLIKISDSDEFNLLHAKKCWNEAIDNLNKSITDLSKCSSNSAAIKIKYTSYNISLLTQAIELYNIIFANIIIKQTLKK